MKKPKNSVDINILLLHRTAVVCHRCHKPQLSKGHMHKKCNKVTGPLQFVALTDFSILCAAINLLHIRLA